VRPHHLWPLIPALALVACGGDDAAPTMTTTASASGFPVETDSCGEPFTLDAPPDRVVLLGNDPISPLATIGALDRVIATTAAVSPELYDATTAAAAAAIPQLSAGTGATGGAEISQEAIIAEQPDLVIGYETETLTRAGLRSAGIPLYVIPAFCPDGAREPVGFDDVGRELAIYGRMFGASDAATAAAATLDARVEAVRAAAAGAPTRTGAVLYVPTAGAALYAYGPASMAHPQLGILGIENVFGDLHERVVEITREELIARDPDVLVLLYGDDGDPVTAEQAVRQLPGADTIGAVATDTIVAQRFALTDPPNPLSVTGLEQLAARLLP
jgi:iron complex transport system substrate-binding protein